ncbi:MAG: hypothetical protein HY646_03685 [Acidobacteria bacterium]|nr:hypothetical protein [Acidobacteriota bacterium]
MTPIARLTPIRQHQDDDLIIEEAIDPPSEARKIKPLKPLDVDRVLAEMRADR